MKLDAASRASESHRRNLNLGDSIGFAWYCVATWRMARKIWLVYIIIYMYYIVYKLWYSAALKSRERIRLVARWNTQWDTYITGCVALWIHATSKDRRFFSRSALVHTVLTKIEFRTNLLAPSSWEGGRASSAAYIPLCVDSRVYPWGVNRVLCLKVRETELTRVHPPTPALFLSSSTR